MNEAAAGPSPPTVVTFTANPSIDRTLEVDEFTSGTVLRSRTIRLDPGGKGLNVTRALGAHGVPSVAVLPSGGRDGDRLLTLLREEGLVPRAVQIHESVRTNITIVEPHGRTTQINEPGPTLSGEEVAALEREVLHAAAGADWVVLAGTLPPGAPSQLYTDLVGQLRARGSRVAVDVDGRLLGATLTAAPDLVKPNRDELAEAAGRSVSTVGEALDAVAVLRAKGARSVLASLGAQGAVLVEGSGAHHATSPAVDARSTVGAGDALLAGFLSAGASGPGALATAVAWGRAAVTLPGSAMPRPDQVDHRGIIVTRLDLPGIAA